MCAYPCVCMWAQLVQLLVLDPSRLRSGDSCLDVRVGRTVITREELTAQELLALDAAHQIVLSNDTISRPHLLLGASCLFARMCVPVNASPLVPRGWVDGC